MKTLPPFNGHNAIFIVYALREKRTVVNQLSCSKINYLTRAPRKVNVHTLKKLEPCRPGVVINYLCEIKNAASLLRLGRLFRLCRCCCCKVKLLTIAELMINEFRILTFSMK